MGGARALTLDFLTQGENVIFVGAQGLGKTMLAKNLVHQAVLAGHSGLFVTTSELLLDLNGQETSRALERRLRHYARPTLLTIDEIGYLSYDARAADLLYQVVSRRCEQKSVVLTTSRLQALGQCLFQRRVRRRPGRSPDPPRRDHRHRRRQLPPPRGRHPAETAPSGQMMRSGHRPPSTTCPELRGFTRSRTTRARMNEHSPWPWS